MKIILIISDLFFPGSFFFVGNIFFHISHFTLLPVFLHIDTEILTNTRYLCFSCIKRCALILFIYPKKKPYISFDPKITKQNYEKKKLYCYQVCLQTKYLIELTIKMDGYHLVIVRVSL